MPRKPGGGRPMACARCRRQKLKCDKEKPCILCYRAGVECQPRDDVKVAWPSESRNQKPGSAQSSSPPGSNGDVSRPAHCGHSKTPSNIAARGQVPKKSNAPKKTGSTTGLASTTAAMRFAQRLLRNDTWNPNTKMQNAENELLHILVGDDPQPHFAAPWQFKNLERPEVVVVDLLMDMYFARAHWFILLFHAPTAKERMRQLWQKATWQRTDAGDILVVLAISALGGICVLNDTTWHGHKILDHYDIDLSSFSHALMSEVKDHLLEVMGDCSLATVQLCLLFCRYCTYTGNSGMGWSLTGMAARNAYAAGLHLAPTEDEDSVQNEVRRRVWLTAKTTDTFSAFYHGRPPSLDSSFRYRKGPHHMDDMELPLALANHPLLNRYGAQVNLFTFHRLKYEIYDIMSQVLSVFRRIRQDTIFADNYLLLVKTIQETEVALNEWRLKIPPFFDYGTWESNDPFDLLHNQGASWYQEARVLTLQSMTLQVTFDSTIIAIHRPLIELGMGSTSQIPSELTREDVSSSMHAAVEAAIRTSRVAIEVYEKEQPVAYILLMCLTACVLLCIPPIHEPMSERAHRSKEGILRIIHACKNLSAGVPLAEHIYGLLSSLMKAVVDRETIAALANGNMEATGTQNLEYPSHSSDGPQQHPAHSMQAQFDSNQMPASHAFPPSAMDDQRGGSWMANAVNHRNTFINQQHLMPSPQTYQTERSQTFHTNTEEASSQIAGPLSTSPSSLFSLLPQESGRGWHWPSAT